MITRPAVRALGVVAAGAALLAGLAAPAQASPATQPSTVAVQRATTSSTTDEPLIIVLDVSGSMDDADGSGGVKLASAKAAVERAVRARGDGATVGVWAFPNQSSCSSGGFVVPPQQIDDRSLTADASSVTAKVDALVTRDGGTPIGAALRDSAAALTLRGFTSATMLLVTDGLNNCDPDPCTEAKAVQRSGFDLTVDAIGFRTDSNANDALTCIARTTGGSFTSADDGTALQQTLAGLAVPHLTMQLAYASEVRAGSSPQITVTVTNPSSNLAADVRANLAFRRDADRAIMPAVVPPTFRFGNLPAGATDTRTWTLTTSASDAGTVADFTATAWGADAGTTQQDGRFAVTDTEVSPEGRLFANLSKHPLLILGDSFSSGEGSGDYLAASAHATKDCHRSENTYVADRMAASQVEIVACSGAVIENYTDDQYDGDTWRAGPQDDQVKDLDRAPGAVLLTFGGNDAGFADIIKGCIKHRVLAALAACSATDAAGQTELTDVASLQYRMTPLYEAVWRDVNSPKFVAERGGAYAPVIVSTYPQELKSARYGDCSWVFTTEATEYGNEIASGLMAAAKAGVARAAADGYEVYFAPTPLTAFLPDHTYCAADAQTDVRRISVVDQQESMHPNANGYSDITDALVAWQSTIERFAPGAVAKARAAQAPTNLLGGLLTAPLQLTVPTVVLQPDGAARLQSGQTSNLQASGYVPGTPVAFVLHSTPLLLGTAITDAHGIARLRASVPAVASLGRHELRAEGVDAAGHQRVVAMPATVTEATPVWLALLLAACAALVVLCAVLLVRLRLRSRRPDDGPSA